jgi:acyl carrier protein
MTSFIKQESMFFKRAGVIDAHSFRHRSDDAATVGLKMRNSSADIQGRILALVTAILEQNAINAELHPQSRLVDVGLTSMDMVNLMLSVEAEFDFTLPQSAITPENFQSIETLEAMILGQLQSERAA